MSGMTEYLWILYAITLDKQIGDLLGSTLNPDPSGAEEFTTGLRLIGSVDTVPVAWFTSVLLKISGHSVVDQFASGGYPELFVQAGLTNQQIDDARPLFLLEYGLRDAMPRSGLAFITAMGYEIIP